MKIIAIIPTIILVLAIGFWIWVINHYEPDPDGTHEVEYNDYGWSDYDPIVWGTLTERNEK